MSAFCVSASSYNSSSKASSLAHAPLSIPSVRQCLYFLDLEKASNSGTEGIPIIAVVKLPHGGCVRAPRASSSAAAARRRRAEREDALLLLSLLVLVKQSKVAPAVCCVEGVKRCSGEKERGERGGDEVYRRYPHCHACEEHACRPVY